jgi:uncharacterized protein
MQAHGSARTASFLSKDFYVIRTAPKLRQRNVSAVGLKPEVLKAIFDRHISYQLLLEKTGRLFAAGPVFDQKGNRAGGLIVIRAKSFEDAKRTADADPHHASNLWRYELQRWRVNEGSFTVTVKYSSKSAKVS